MRPVAAALLTLAQAPQAAVQYAFQFSSPQIPGASWCYTSPQALTINGQLFTAVRIQLDTRAGAADKIDTDDFVIECAPLEPFLSLIGGGLPFLWTAQVWEVFVDGSGNLLPDLVATGTLASAESTDTGFKLTFNALANWLDIQIPKQLVGLTDPRIPWSADFAVDPTTPGLLTTATVSSLTQNLLYSTAANVAADTFANSILQYQRTLAGQLVTLTWPVATNVPAPDPAHPEWAYFILYTPPRALAPGDADLLIYPGYAGTAAASLALGNFYSRLVLTVAQITKATDLSAVAANTFYPLPGNLQPVVGWQSSTLNGVAAEGTGYTFTTVAGKTGITFAAVPVALDVRLDLRWQNPDTSAARGFQGFPDLPWYSPVTNSQVPAQSTASGALAPAIDHFAIGAYPITTAPEGATISLVAATGTSFGAAQATTTIREGTAPSYSYVTLPATSVTVNGVVATVVAWATNVIKVTLPALAAGSYPVSAATVAVICRLGTGNTASNFTVSAPLTITGPAGTASIDHVEDLNGNVITAEAASVPVTIVGFGLAAATTTGRAVNFGATAVASGWTNWTANAIVGVPVPAGAGAVTLSVNTGAATVTDGSFTLTGSTGASLIDHFENLHPLTITSCTATQKIRIVGNGFGVTRGTGWVKFNGLEVIAGGGSYVSWTNKLIVVKVPVPASFPAMGNVVVQTGAGLTSVGVAFTIGAAAGSVWIDSFQNYKVPHATIGTVNAGTKLWIVGENFGAGGPLAYVRQAGSPAQDFTVLAAGWTNLLVIANAPASQESGAVTVHTQAGLNSVNTPTLVVA